MCMDLLMYAKRSESSISEVVAVSVLLFLLKAPIFYLVMYCYSSSQLVFCTFGEVILILLTILIIYL